MPFQNKLLFAGSLLISVGFCLQVATPAFLSLGVALVLVHFLLHVRTFRAAIFPSLFIAYWALLLLSVTYSADTSAWSNVLFRQLPLLFLPLAWTTTPTLSRQQYRTVQLVLAITVSVFALLTLLRYLLHYEVVNALLLESKSVPVWDGISSPFRLDLQPDGTVIHPGISHIYFSILQAFVVLSSGYFLSRKELSGAAKWIFCGTLVINLVLLHIFTARTGLMALYAAAFALLGLYAIQTRSKKLLVVGLLLITCVPVASYFAFGSVRNKITNTLQDLEAANGQSEINHRSFAMRLDAWKSALRVIGEHPLLGVGAGDADTAMQQAYTQRNSTLTRQNRIPPHNQFLESGVALGLTGLLTLLALFIVPLFRPLLRKHPLFLGCLVMWFVAIQFESVLQTQVGVTFFAFSLLGCWSLAEKEATV